MMTHRVLVMTLAFILATTVSAALHAEEPVSTAFVYQGQLKQAGIPVNGAADFRFTLWDATTDGVRIGEVVPKDNVTLTDGMFTAEMDFGMSAFTGGARWLEIEIRSPAWEGQGEEPLFTILSPRQAITAAPLAIHALTGGTGDGHSLDALDGDPVDAVTVDQNGNVGIGTPTPQGAMHIETNHRIPLRILTSDNVARLILEGTGGGSIRSTGADTSKFLSLQATSSIQDGAQVLISGLDHDSQGLGRGGVKIETARQSTEGDILFMTQSQNRLIVNQDGGVGVGTTEPLCKLHVEGAAQTAGGWPGLVYLKQTGSYGRNLVMASTSNSVDVSMSLRPSDDPANAWEMKAGSVDDTQDFKIHRKKNNVWKNDFFIGFESGDVGIGTTNPNSRMHVVGGSDATTSSGGYLVLGTTTDVNMVLDNNEIMSRSNGEPSDLYLNRDGGNVVIGGDTVQTQLHVSAESPSMRIAASNNHVSSLQLYEGANYGFEFQYDGNWDKLHLWSRKFSGNEGIRMTWLKSGNVGIGTTTPACKLDVAGTTRTEVIQITGADVAEKFPVVENVEPGMVVAIDPKDPGKLCVARGTYNRCVAGVVSGAGDLPTGAILGNLPDQEDAPPIALSGRVWTYCDADASGAIQPGDLLTTSDTPGYAMRVTDHPRAGGAVLGKAMTRLENGRGLVLVLVSLQ